MPSRLVLHNKTVWRSPDDKRIDWTQGLPTRVRGNRLNREVDPIDCTTAIERTEDTRPFTAGHGVMDTEEQVVYRVVTHLNPADGWASTAFWQDRYKIFHHHVLELARLHFLDAAMEEGSQVRRFRCRNEEALKADPILKRLRGRATKSRHKKRLGHAMKRA